MVWHMFRHQWVPWDDGQSLRADNADMVRANAEFPCRANICTWPLFPHPIKGRNGAPTLMVTNPEGQTFGLDDIHYYPGQCNWADLEDKDED